MKKEDNSNILHIWTGGLQVILFLRGVHANVRGKVHAVLPLCHDADGVLSAEGVGV